MQEVLTIIFILLRTYCSMLGRSTLSSSSLGLGSMFIVSLCHRQAPPSRHSRGCARVERNRHDWKYDTCLEGRCRLFCLSGARELINLKANPMKAEIEERNLTWTSAAPLLGNNDV
jgi:hypothetical protein